MTTIVYDNNSLITDSRVLSFLDSKGVSKSKNKNKIVINESKTVAIASCGIKYPAMMMEKFMLYAEAEFALSYMTSSPYLSTNKSFNEFFQLVISSHREYLKTIIDIKSLKPEFIAITRDYQIKVTDGLSFQIEDGNIDGIGMYLDAYLLWRQQGLSPAACFKKLDTYSDLSGGPVNIIQQSQLLPPSYLQLVVAITLYGKDDKIKHPKLKALDKDNKRLNDALLYQMMKD